MPASRSTDALFPLFVLLRMRKLLKKLLLLDVPFWVGCAVRSIELSASGSSDMERTRRISVRLWIVVEQLIWPPR